MTREEAIERILLALRSPLHLMDFPMREELYNLCGEHNITVKELLDNKRKLSKTVKDIFETAKNM